MCSYIVYQTLNILFNVLILTLSVCHPHVRVLTFYWITLTYPMVGRSETSHISIAFSSHTREATFWDVGWPRKSDGPHGKHAFSKSYKHFSKKKKERQCLYIWHVMFIRCLLPMDAWAWEWGLLSASLHKWSVWVVLGLC